MTEPTATTPAARRVSWRHGLIGLSWLLLTVYFHSPVREVMTPTLDGSNFASYAWFTAHGSQYGADVMPMAGPYGFIMYGTTYSGQLFGLRTAGELLLNGALAALTLWFFLRQRGSWVRWLWLAAHLAFTPFIEDLPIEWLLLLGGFFLLQRAPRPAPVAAALAVTALLALLSLIKGTQLVLGLATLGVVLAGHAWHRDGKRVALLAAGYGAALLLWWLAAGQSIRNLPAYFDGILELASGYNDTMGLVEPAPVFWRGLLVSAVLAASLAWAGWLRRRDAISLATLALLAGHSFVQWKHGFVRADGHAYIYFHFALVAAVTVWLVGQHPAVPGRSRASVFIAASLLLASWALGCLGRHEPMLPAPHEAPGAIIRRLAGHFQHLASLPRIRREFARQWESQRFDHDMPLTRHAVGQASIDLFGFEHGLIPLNGLRYQPRPMSGGSFNAYTPGLMQLNRDFLRDPARRPDFYLLRIQTIDDRFAAQDDGLALFDLLYLYEPFALEHAHLLLRSRPGAVPPVPVLHSRRTFGFGESVPVPAVAGNELLLARFIVPASLTGKIRSLLYKPATVGLALRTAGGIPLPPRRLVPRMASSPFVFSPVIGSTDDFFALHTTDSGRTLESFTLATAAPAAFARELTVEFYRAPRPGPLPAPVAAELRDRFRFPFANRVPDTITPAFRPHDSVFFLHPPAELVWNLAGNEREFTFDYGIAPEAYERGTTNGVDFIVEVRDPSGGRHPAFHRLLRPVAEPADRGRHTASVLLPVYAPGSRLVLRTDPGEYGDAAWDWAYVTRMELKAGGYRAEQFPGFSRVPDFAEAENAGLAELDGQKIFLLHVPGTVGFALTGEERQLSLEFGFLPGAYSNGGATPGADFIVELVRPGQPGRELLRRTLQPVTASADRDRQTARIPLPPTQPGDQLRLRTATLPGGNNSWGWTYFSRLIID